MSRWFLVCAVAAVAIGHLDILVMIGCVAVVIWFARHRRRGAAG